MTKHLKTKREAAQRAEYAVAYVIANPGATYKQAARIYRVSSGAIRGRIEARFGSLDYARQLNGHEPVKAIKSRIRKCLICGTCVMLPRNVYACTPCRQEIAKLHDGHV